MYKAPLNSRFMINQRRLVQSSRLMSTQATVRKGGISKLVMGVLVVSAAGMAYYNRTQKDNQFYNGDSDPYEKTKKNVSDIGDKLLHDTDAKHKSQDALDELNAAGQHIKNSANLAGQAAQDAFSNVKNEGQTAVHNFKDETYKLKENIKSDADRFLSEHHLKEGDRTPEDVLSHTTNEDIKITPLATASTYKSSDSNAAAFKATNKFKETKDNVSHEIEKGVKKATDFIKEEKDNLRKSAQEHNPMVYEKLSSAKTKPDWETRLEDHTTNVVHDTTSLVEKDTNKVKKVWEDNKDKAKDAIHEIEDEAKSAWNGLWGVSKSDKEDYPPTTNDKLTDDRYKTSADKKLDKYANEVVHDTTPLVDKDTKKVKKVWDDVNADVDADAKVAADKADKESKSFWGSMFGGFSKAEDVKQDHTPAIPQKEYTTYDHAAPTIEGNPMVLEKRSKEKTKPLWETSLEEHANEVVHDTSTLVDKDTEKVKKGVWDAKEKANYKGAATRSAVAQEHDSWWNSIFGKAEDKATELESKAANQADETKSKWEGVKNKVGSTADDVKRDASATWEDAKARAASEADRVKKNVNSTIDDLSEKSKKESSRLESGWSNLKNQVSNDAEHMLHSAEDATHSVSNKFKKEASNVKDESSRLSRQASDRVDYEKDRLSSNLNDLHKEVSSNAEKWKNQGEQTAKSWYQKGTEQVRSGFTTVKNVADQDLQWAEQKAQDGVESLKSTLGDAKEEVDRLLGFRNEKEEDYSGHVVRGEKFAEEEPGHLRATRTHVGLKPAEVVVEEAHSKDM